MTLSPKTLAVLKGGTQGEWRHEPPRTTDDDNCLMAGDDLLLCDTAFYPHVGLADGDWPKIALVNALADVAVNLSDPPILSKYHGERGFEIERFIADYEAWMARKRTVYATLEAEASKHG